MTRSAQSTPTITSPILFSRTLSHARFSSASPASLLFPKPPTHVSASGPLHLRFPLSGILFPQVAELLGLLLSSGLCSNVSQWARLWSFHLTLSLFPTLLPALSIPLSCLHFSPWHLLPSNRLNILLICFVQNWSPLTRMKLSFYFAGFFPSLFCAMLYPRI